MYEVHDVGGLAVAYSPADEKSISLALRRLDPHLFLDKELEPIGPRGPYVYPVVKLWVGSEHPPIPVLEWRDRDGPWPLSMAIVDKVRHQEGSLDGAVKRVIAANERKRQSAIEETGASVEEIARGGYQSARGSRSVLLPRSQSLRQSRDRSRAKGRKV